MASTPNETMSITDLGLVARLDGRRNGTGWTAFCPAHDDRRKPWLSISLVGEDRILVYCHAGCSQNAVREALGVEWASMFSTACQPAMKQKRKTPKTTIYKIKDAAGNVVAEHIRRDQADGSKSFTWRRDGATGLQGLRTEDLPLYGLGDALAAPRGSRRVVTEGEKARDALKQAGVLTVGTITGAAGCPATKVLTQALSGLDCYLWPDNDAPGRSHVQRVAARMVEAGLPAPKVIAWPEAPKGGDAFDYFEGHTDADVSALVEAATTHKPSNPTTPPLDDIRALVESYIVATGHQLDAISLWVAHTHAIDGADCTPYLNVSSAEKESGKTRLLECLDLVVARPWLTSRTTAAALARKVDKDVPTLLLDESDSAFKSGEEYAETLRGVLNSGYRRSGKVTVCFGQGTNMDTRDLSTFAPKTIAGLGHLPDTVASRSIPIRLKRRAAHEPVQRFKLKDALREARPIHEALERWAPAAIDPLRISDPVEPFELADRAAEVWEPLLAIADLAGRLWPERARAAAVALSGVGLTDDESLDVKLLRDIRQAFGDRGHLPSTDLVAALVALEEAPWGSLNDGKALTARGLARMLSRYSLGPKSIRADGTVYKGYSLEAFRDAWSRYTPDLSDTSVTPRGDAVQGEHLSVTPENTDMPFRAV